MTINLELLEQLFPWEIKLKDDNTYFISEITIELWIIPMSCKNVFEVQVYDDETNEFITNFFLRQNTKITKKMKIAVLRKLLNYFNNSYEGERKYLELTK